MSSHLALPLLAGVAIGSVIVAIPQARAEVGVAAAVNTDARGQAPGAAPRVLALGQKVVFNERISTDASGQAQILLLDGTTFTVGPNSDLAIDEFVFNPETGSAKVVASVTKGAFRFIGAKTSQSPDGVTINTQVGTIGVRGGSVVCGMSGGQFVCMMPFGKAVNIQSKDGSTHTIFKSGWLLAFDENGNFIEERKAKPQEVGIITAALNGKGSGGTSGPPDDGTVQSSEVPTTNSQLPNTIPVSVLMEAVKSNPLTETIVDNKAQDDIDQDIENPPGPTTFAARLLTSPDTYVGYDALTYPNAGSRGLVGSSPETDQVVLFQRTDGRLIANGPGVDINLPDFTGEDGDDAETAGLYEYSLSSEDGAYSGEEGLLGNVYAGVGDFAAYMLNHEGNLDDPFYLITGTPTSTATFEDMEAGSNIRRYTLTNDPLRSDVPVPFFANDEYGGNFTVSNYRSSDLMIIEPGNSANGDIRAMQSWVHIEGTGASQKSAAMVFTGTLWSDPDTGGEYILSGGRRGTFQGNSIETGTLSTVNMRGGIESIGGAQSNLQNGTGGHIFGPNANHFVIGQPIGTEPDRYGDNPLNPSDYFSGDPNEGYSGDGNFGTHHVANLVSDQAPAPGSRTNRDLDGFMVGVGASDAPGPRYVLANSGNDSPPLPNLELKLSATNNSVYAQSTVSDVYDGSSVVESMLLTFGGEVATPGTNAFIDNNNYAARRANDQTLTELRTDGGPDFANSEGASAGSYLVSGRTNPIANYEHCTQCTFIEWGWWGTQVAVESTDPQINGYRRDQVHMGTYVAGDITTAAQIAALTELPFGGFVSYDGTAMGTVVNGSAQYIAKGDFHMAYDFGSRDGWAEINNFDGINIGSNFETEYASPNVQGFTSGGQELFSGSLTNGTYNGDISGAFVNNGPNAIAAGAIGSFSFGGSGYSAVGTIAAVGSEYVGQ